ncbi:RNA recognition motif domain - like 10 [Theobroma cacao]|nr:RNA recognition motif domain - like 10 [Theobroma cacao]
MGITSSVVEEFSTVLQCRTSLYPSCILVFPLVLTQETSLHGILLFLTLKGDLHFGKERDGTTILLWLDKWLENLPLSFKYPRFFSLATNKVIRVADAKSNGSWSLNFKWALFSWEKLDYEELLCKLSYVVLVLGRKDKLVWKHDHQGNFSVKTFCSWLNAYDNDYMHVKAMMALMKLVGGLIHKIARVKEPLSAFDLAFHGYHFPFLCSNLMLMAQLEVSQDLLVVGYRALNVVGGRKKDPWGVEKWRRTLFTAFVGNLLQNVEWRQLKGFFDEFGVVVDIFLPRPRRSTATRYAFMRYREERELCGHKGGGSRVVGEKCFGTTEKLNKLWFSGMFVVQGRNCGTDERSFNVWVKLEEIPLHVWHESSFKAIRDTWGRFIKADKDTMESWRLDQALICVEVKSLKHITTYTHLKVNGRDYFIRATIVDVVKSEPRVKASNYGEGTSNSKSKSQWSEEGQHVDWVKSGGCTPIKENCTRTVARMREEENLQSLLARPLKSGYFS